jgi:aryl-alcohol dehydrogenase-like predicted oxidoreductase
VTFYIAADKLVFDLSQDETSEEFIGEWAEKRGIRDQLVIATKASPDFLPIEPLHEALMPMTSIQPTSSGARIRSLTR